MALEDDIKKAFEESIGGESVQTQKLASDLTIAIKKFMNELTFRIVNAEMSTILTNIQGVPNAGGPVTIPFIDLTVAISDAGDKTQNPKGKIESIKSEVKVDEAKMRSL
tara:strand:+ start:455 stop:781 length:327 start_codon:yes stop_codon:yes gene_type:complete